MRMIMRRRRNPDGNQQQRHPPQQQQQRHKRLEEEQTRQDTRRSPALIDRTTARGAPHAFRCVNVVTFFPPLLFPPIDCLPTLPSSARLLFSPQNHLLLR